MKKCSKCKKEKEYIHFYKDKIQKDGYYPTCKLCKNAYLTLHRRSNYGKQYNKNYYNTKKRQDYLKRIDIKLAASLRNRTYLAIRDNQKSGSAVRDLGCTIPELKIYLEKQFKEGMVWENRGKWHIDHIIPLSSFDLTKREQFLIACNYKNLQPLWAKENMSKRNRV